MRSPVRCKLEPNHLESGLRPSEVSRANFQISAATERARSIWMGLLTNTTTSFCYGSLKGWGGSTCNGPLRDVATNRPKTQPNIDRGYATTNRTGLCLVL